MAIYITRPYPQALPEIQMYPPHLPPPIPNSHSQTPDYDRLYSEYMSRRHSYPQLYPVYLGDRLFRPSLLGLGDHAKVCPTDVMSYNPRTALTHPIWIDDRWNRFEDPATVIMHSSSAFTMSSSSSSSAILATTSSSLEIHSRTNSAWATYHGPGSAHNLSGPIPTFLPQSKPHADLYAAGMALEHFRNFVLPGLPPAEAMWRNAIVVTDSAYLLSCLTQNMAAWRLNGYRNAKKKVVSNAATIRWLEDLVGGLERSCVSVVFWKVEKKENHDAVGMAKRALERQEMWDGGERTSRVIGSEDMIPMSSSGCALSKTLTLDEARGQEEADSFVGNG